MIKIAITFLTRYTIAFALCLSKVQKVRGKSWFTSQTSRRRHHKHTQRTLLINKHVFQQRFYHIYSQWNLRRARACLFTLRARKQLRGSDFEMLYKSSACDVVALLSSSSSLVRAGPLTNTNACLCCGVITHLCARVRVCSAKKST